MELDFWSKLFPNSQSVKNKQTNKGITQEESGDTVGRLLCGHPLHQEPYKLGLSEEIRLGSAEESAVHAGVAEPITRKLEFPDRCFSSPAACPRQAHCANRQKERRNDYLMVQNVRAKDEGRAFLIS